MYGTHWPRTGAQIEQISKCWAHASLHNIGAICISIWSNEFKQRHSIDCFTQTTYQTIAACTARLSSVWVSTQTDSQSTLPRDSLFALSSSVSRYNSVLARQGYAIPAAPPCHLFLYTTSRLPPTCCDWRGHPPADKKRNMWVQPNFLLLAGRSTSVAIV